MASAGFKKQMSNRVKVPILTPITRTLKEKMEERKSKLQNG